MRALLSAYDAPHIVAANGTLTLALLGDPAELRPVAEQLAARGWLTPLAAPDAYARTEDGRLALAGPLEVTLYTRAGCHLCDQAKALMAPLLRRAAARLTEVDIDRDPVLLARYNVDVPVIFMGSRKVAKHRVDVRQFKKQLEEARKSQDSHRIEE